MRQTCIRRFGASGRFFQHDTSIGSPHASRHHPGPPLISALPFDELRIYVKGRGGKINFRIGLCVVQTRWEFLVFEGQHRFDDPGNSCRGIQVAHIRLDRTDPAVS